MSPGEHDNDPE
jgi:hypothetical protein